MTEEKKKIKDSWLLVSMILSADFLMIYALITLVAHSTHFNPWGNWNPFAFCAMLLSGMVLFIICLYILEKK
jgi:hypothetical protein